MKTTPDARTTQIEGRWWPTDDRRPDETRAQWLARIDSYTNAAEVRR